MQRPRYGHRPRWPKEDDFLKQPVRRRGVGDLLPYLFGGTMLVAAFAFAGHQIGRNAVARTAEVQAASISMTAATESVAEKSSLFSDGQGFDLLEFAALRSETVPAEGKADMVSLDPGAAPVLAEGAGNAMPKPILKPARKIASLARDKLRILPAAFSAGEAVNGAGSASKLKKAEKQKVIAQRRVRLAEENCLARAVYFEARSESEIGQMAVAKVVLNRVKSPDYPNTICGVVYQGSQRRNSCQFSFACDGLPDDIKQPAAWAQSKRVAQKALAGDPKVASMLGGATNYHADYVKPKWARSMRKAVKIGRHIFYTGG